MDHQSATHLPLAGVEIKRGHIYAIACFIILSTLSFHSVTFEPFLFVRSLPRSRTTAAADYAELCDNSNGVWVRDVHKKKLSYKEDCPFLDPGFRCRWCGRKDEDYMNWRWQPENCDLPRFNASDMLERARNGRIVFAGDSIGRNQWESLLCLLSQAVTNMSTIYEVHGSPITKHKGFLSMYFREYNLSVEYYRDPFLVFMGRPPENAPTKVRMTIKLDQMHWFAERWKGASVLVLNTGHWWNEDKTVKMGIYFEEGGVLNLSVSVEEAFQRSLHTIASWVIENMDAKASHVFFRSYSPVHYRNGSWNDGGRCDMDRQPESNYSRLEPEPLINHFVSRAVLEMKRANVKAQFLNITRLSEFRFDGHPSIHREPGTPLPAPQDCSHWCLPGIPDTWNEILYTHWRRTML